MFPHLVDALGQTVLADKATVVSHEETGVELDPVHPRQLRHLCGQRNEGLSNLLSK